MEYPPGPWWLEYDCFLLGWPIFRGELLVSGSVSMNILHPLMIDLLTGLFHLELDWCGSE